MTTTTPRREQPRRGFTNPADGSNAIITAPSAAPNSTPAPEQPDDPGALGRLRAGVAGAGRLLGAQFRRVRLVSWALIALALLGFNYFTYQTYRVPQAHDYQPNWYGAQWITTNDTPGNVIYMRKDFTLDNTPENAFLTIQASQYVDLYVNGSYLGSTVRIFQSGAVNRAFIYDVTPLLQLGDNVIAMRVETRDIGVAAVRAVLGLVFGSARQVFPSDASWRSTGDALRVFPPYLPLVTSANAGQLNILNGWRSSVFDDTPWRDSVRYTGPLPPTGVLSVDPAVYETPFTQTWLSSGSGTDGYFFRRLTTPDLQSGWLRLASDGSAAVYLNGQLLIQQNEQITTLAAYAGDNSSQVSLYGISTGLYNITPFLRPGVNTLAVHVVMSHYDFITSKPFDRPTTLGIDLLGITPNGSSYYVADDGTWRVSATPTSDWMNGGGIQNWQPGVVVDQAYLSPEPSNKVQGTELERPHTYDVAPIFLITTAIFLLACEVTLAAELWRRRRLTTLAQAIDRLALGFLPLLGVLALLFILSEEPLITNPFPFTTFWLWVLIAVAVVCQLLIILTPRIRFAERRFEDRARLRRIDRQWRTSATAQALAAPPDEAADYAATILPEPTEEPTAELTATGETGSVRARLAALAATLRRRPSASFVGWGLALLGTFLGFLITSYGLNYEPYWQDELATLEVARGILQNGIPHLAPGFIYPKAELYHYELALVIAAFGENPVATRSLAVVAFLATLPLTYFVGSRFFDRRVGLLAMALLLFSPFELWWAQQTRMYQQAQFFVLLVFYFFFRATQPGARRRYIYLSMASVVLMYLSHEEGFIVLPAIFIYFLISQRLTWLRNRDWWIAGSGAIAIIGVQLIIVKLTSQPILGQDISQRPDIGFSAQNVDYYLRMLFDTTTLSIQTYGHYQLTLVSIIGFGTGLVSLLSRNRAFRYTAFFFIASFLTLTFLLSLKADRYFYPLYPELTLLAAVGVIWGMDHVMVIARRRVSPLTARVFVGLCAICLILTILASQVPAVATANLAVSRTLGIPFGRQIPDYSQAGAYIQAHWQPGDALVVMAASNEGVYYAQEDPYTIYLGSSLYIHQQGSHILDNYSNNLVLINEHDLVSVLATYHRVWLLRVTGYYSIPAIHFQIASFFYEVWETDGVTVYLNTP